MLSVIDSALKNGQSVAIDATNPGAAKRREYIDLANKYGVPVLIIYFVGNGYGWNKLRPKPIPDPAYNVLYSHLQEPSMSVDGVPGVEYE